VETTEIALPPGTPPVLIDWRMRECDYGDRNGGSVDALMRDRARHVDEPYSGGESWRKATATVAR
jgi:broad specificity phosphatase PhoE